MAEKCAWLIAWGEGVDPAAQLVAGAARQYGLNVKGQHWPEKEKQAWLASAKEAAQAQAAVILLVTTHAIYAQPENRRAMALFRLLLQSLLNRQVDGVVLLQGSLPAEPLPELFGTAVLGDWMVVGPTDKWVARAVARAHVPTKTSLPLRLSRSTPRNAWASGWNCDLIKLETCQVLSLACLAQEQTLPFMLSVRAVACPTNQSMSMSYVV